MLGPEIGGELTVVHNRAGWHATIGGYTVDARSSSGSLVLFQLPADRGLFRANIPAGIGAIHGHWIQPKRLTDSTAFATPVTLSPLPGQAGSVWRGEVAPLADQASVYIEIAGQPDGSFHAFVRNPEGNAEGRTSFNLLFNGRTLRFAELASGKVQFEATYDSVADALAFRSEDLGGVQLELTRRVHDDAIGFFARPVDARAYQALAPIAENDGWSTAAPGEVGLDSQRIAPLVDQIVHADSMASRTSLVHSLLIARHGKLVVEEYFYGFSKEKVHDIRSAGKTFATTLVGAAIDHGAPFTVSSTVADMFPEYVADLAHPDPRKRAITVDEILSMRTGLACDENSDDVPGNENAMQNQSAQPDWYKWTLDLPLAHNPGDYAAYCAPTMNLSGGVLAHATHRWVPELFDSYLAQPLQFGHYYFNLSPTGEGYLAGGLYLRPRDFLKLGQLFLDNGIWNGRRVVSAKWVATATAEHARLNNGTVDGYNWWLTDVKVADRVYHAYSATGNGGQLVTVVPELDLVVGFTAGNYNDFRTWSKFNSEWLSKYILPGMNPQRSPRLH